MYFQHGNIVKYLEVPLTTLPSGGQERADPSGVWMESGCAAPCRQQTHLSPCPRPAVINYLGPTKLLTPLLECGTVIVIVIHIWYGRYFSTKNQPLP